MLIELIDQIHRKYSNNLLFIGYRGSRVYGIQTNQSDYDLTVVIKEGNTERMKDTLVYSKDTFINEFYKGELDIVEALYNQLFVSDNFKDTFSKLREISKTEEYQELFACSLVLSLKNYIKRYNKFGNIKYALRGSFFRDMHHSISIKERSYWSWFQRQTSYYVLDNNINVLVADIINYRNSFRDSAKSKKAEISRKLKNTYSSLLI